MSARGRRGAAVELAAAPGRTGDDAGAELARHRHRAVARCRRPRRSPRRPPRGPRADGGAAVSSSFRVGTTIASRIGVNMREMLAYGPDSSGTSGDAAVHELARFLQPSRPPGQRPHGGRLGEGRHPPGGRGLLPRAALRPDPDPPGQPPQGGRLRRRPPRRHPGRQAHLRADPARAPDPARPGGDRHPADPRGGRDPQPRRGQRPHRRRDGGPRRLLDRRPRPLRHGQGGREGRRDHRPAAGGQERRPDGRLPAGPAGGMEDERPHRPRPSPRRSLAPRRAGATASWPTAPRSPATGGRSTWRSPPARPGRRAPSSAPSTASTASSRT